MLFENLILSLGTLYTYSQISKHIFFSARPSKLKAKLIIAGIWMTSGALAAPMAVALRVVMVTENSSCKFYKPNYTCVSVEFSFMGIVSKY